MFSKFFIYRPIFAAVVSLVILILGGVSIPALPIENTPNITPPTVKVATSYPGANALTIAETVTTPLEQELNGVENMLYMSSTSSDDGSCEITITFEVGTDVDMATVLVQNRVSTAMAKLPEEVKREGVVTKKQSTSVVLMVNLISPDGRYDEIFLSNYVTTRIKDALARVKGVGEVLVWGAKDFGMRIWLDPDKAAQLGVTVTDVVGAIREQNVQVAAGQIGAPPAPPGQVFQLTINARGRLQSVEEFENIVVKTAEDGRTVLVKDVVSRVELGAQSYQWFVELDGKPSIAVPIYQLPGANALEVAEGIRAEMERQAQDFPEGVEYAIVYDTTKFITASINEVITTLFVAVLLVVLTVYVFLQDFRTTLIPAATIPVSLVGTFAVMLAVGISINTLSLFGLVLAIGIVVDDAIVVVENTMRIIDEEGLAPKEATAKAMREVTGPVIATTLVLLAVFVPTAMMSGITGRLYSQFAVTISIATVFSSVNALTLSPALCGLLLRPSKEKRALPWRLFNAALARATGGYTGAVSLLTRRLALVALLFLAVVFGAGWLMNRVPKGFMPTEDQGYALIQAVLPDGATLGRTERAMEQINEIVETTPGVANYVSVGGYSILDGLMTSNAAAYFVVFEDWDRRGTDDTTQGAILGSLNRRLAGVRSAAAFAFPPPAIQGLGAAGGFEYQLQDRSGSADLSLLDVAGKDLVRAARESPVIARPFSSFRATVPQLFVDVNRIKAKRLGVPLDDVFMTLQANLGSLYVNDFNIFGRVYRVMVQADQQYRDAVSDIGRLQVRDRSGNMIPLDTLLTVEETAGPQAVFRYNLYPSTKITGDTNPGYSTGQAIDEMERLSAEVLPPGFGYEWTGITFQQIQAGQQAIFIFAMAAVFVFLVLAAQYESWSIPLAVLLTLPAAIFGAIGSIYLARFIGPYDNNVYTQIGFVLLIGLASKNAILIVEFAKAERESGKSVVEAALEAARLRFRPILMTAFSFILGVLPLVVASGAGAWARRSLGTAVFGGMVTAVVVGVFLIPLLYIIVQGTSERLRSGKRASRPAPTRTGTA